MERGRSFSCGSRRAGGPACNYYEPPSRGGYRHFDRCFYDRAYHLPYERPPEYARRPLPPMGGGDPYSRFFIVQGKRKKQKNFEKGSISKSHDKSKSPAKKSSKMMSNVLQPSREGNEETPVILSLHTVKQETIKNEEPENMDCMEQDSQAIIHEHENNIKNEPLDGHHGKKSEMQDNTGEIEIGNKKRKEDFEEEFEIKRKRSNIKEELPDGSQNNQSVLVQENVLENSHAKQIQEDNIESTQDMKNDEYLDDDITILPVLKEEKEVPLITISDEEDGCDSGSEMQTSTGILRYFNIASELDRYDCQDLLESLTKYHAKSNLEFFFPIVKIESKSKLEIKKGDILFKTDENIHLSAESVSQNSHLHNAEVNAPPSLQATISPSTSNSNINASKKNSKLMMSYALQPARDGNEEPPVFLPLPTINLGIIKSEEIIDCMEQNSSENNRDLHSVLECGNKVSVKQEPTETEKQSFVSSIVNTNRLLKEPLVISKESQDIIHENETNATSSIKNEPLDGDDSTSEMQDNAGDKHELEKIVASFTGNLPSLLPSTETNNVSNYSQRLPLRDPRCRKRLPTVLNGNSIQDVVPQVPTQPAIQLPSHNFQNYSASPSTSTFESQSAVMNQGPCHALRYTFPPRKGANTLLYHNVGRDDITEYFGKLVLQWNPEWLKFQKSAIYPPICNSYASITTSYLNQTAYFNTYISFHMLHVWCSIFKCWCNIFEHWSNRRKGIQCKILSVEKTDIFSIICSTEINDGDKWPIGDDIALCSHHGEEAFFRVESVLKKPTDIDRISKLKITLESLHDLKLQPADTVEFFILFNIRIAYLEAKALKSLDDSMRDVILQPEFNQQLVEVVGLAAANSQEEHRDDVLKALYISHVHVVVVETCPSADVPLLITHVADNIACSSMNNEKNLSKVLICLKHDTLLEKVFRYLINYNPVLVVRTKQMSLPENLAEYTLENYLRKKTKLSDILSNRIFITTFSAFGPEEQKYLSKLNRVEGSTITCIVEAAHLCSEAETALPLTLKLKKLVLIGNRFENFEFSEILKQHYNKSFYSLYLRLLKAKHRL